MLESPNPQVIVAVVDLDQCDARRNTQPALSCVSFYLSRVVVILALVLERNPSTGIETICFQASQERRLAPFHRTPKGLFDDRSDLRLDDKSRAIPAPCAPLD